MAKLMEIETSFDSGSPAAAAPAAVTIDPDRYQKFMTINPIQDYFNIPKSEYLMQTREQRLPLMEKYYKNMVNGKFVLICKNVHADIVCFR